MLFSWVLFRADNLTAAVALLRRHVRTRGRQRNSRRCWRRRSTRRTICWCWPSCAVLVFQPLQAHDWACSPVTWARIAVLVPLFVFSLMTMFSQAFNPFLYFQF